MPECLPSEPPTVCRRSVKSPPNQTADKVPYEGSLAPGDFPNQAPSFDLPVALGGLADIGELIPDRLEHYAIIGELELESNTWPVNRSRHGDDCIRRKPFRLVTLALGNRSAAPTAIVLRLHGSVKETLS